MRNFFNLCSLRSPFFETVYPCICSALGLRGTCFRKLHLLRSSVGSLTRCRRDRSWWGRSIFWRWWPGVYGQLRACVSIPRGRRGPPCGRESHVSLRGVFLTAGMFFLLPLSIPLELFRFHIQAGFFHNPVPEPYKGHDSKCPPKKRPQCCHCARYYTYIWAIVKSLTFLLDLLSL